MKYCKYLNISKNHMVYRGMERQINHAEFIAMLQCIALSIIS